MGEKNRQPQRLEPTAYPTNALRDISGPRNLCNSQNARQQGAPNSAEPNGAWSATSVAACRMEQKETRHGPIPSQLCRQIGGQPPGSSRRKVRPQARLQRALNRCPHAGQAENWAVQNTKSAPLNQGASKEASRPSYTDRNACRIALTPCSC